LSPTGLSEGGDLSFVVVEKTVYLVGTLHRYQGCTPRYRLAKKQELEQFKTFLRRAIHDHKILSVAEEMTIEALKKYPHPDLPPGQSTPFQVATELNLFFQYCDLDTPMRRQLGISEDDDEKREAYWVEQLAKFDLFPCLFVLGSKHSSTFADLLKRSGFWPILLSEEWSPPT